jgi:type I restriction enzyme S subunit
LLKRLICASTDLVYGESLSSLDALIAAQSEKIDALKSHKKGLMQQLFPSPEATT